MAKVENEKSETKKKEGDNQHSFQKNTSEYHEEKDRLAKASTSPTSGASGNRSKENSEQEDRG